jgi:hypothetical protein
MNDIEPTVQKYCQDMADTLTETMERYDCSEYEHLWQIFIDDVAKENYYTHFNFRLLNDDISLQARTNVGMAIMEYMERIEKQGAV